MYGLTKSLKHRRIVFLGPNFEVITHFCGNQKDLMGTCGHGRSGDIAQTLNLFQVFHQRVPTSRHVAHPAVAAVAAAAALNAWAAATESIPSALWPENSVAIKFVNPLQKQRLEELSLMKSD